jgi:aryl-alcohol dehydrogenase-like predicted oxidoreductase
MANLVLGGVALATMPNLKLERLLGAATLLGINEIDTAPSYGLSEENIGRCVEKSEWKINTKIGKPGGGCLGRQEIIQSVNNSLKNLRVETINTLFIHSLPASEVSHEILESMNDLKTSGKILNIGYSGDGADLYSLVRKFPFDALQASLNILDLSNYESIANNEKKIWYIKRALCNQVFRIKPKLELIEFLSGRKNRIMNDENAYSYRYKELFGNRILSQIKAKKMLTFLLSLRLNASIIVGTSNIDHLNLLSQISNDPDLWDEETLEQHFIKWNRFAQLHNWRALV